jgi:hypothetical protein
MTPRKILPRDLTGMVFGRLTAICPYNEDTPSEKQLWLCRCECGKEKAVGKFCLLRGTTRSCGCLQRETASALARTHGKSRTKTFRAWAKMHERCLNPNCPGWKNYGGRGITICPEWLSSFSNFLRDMGECPPDLSIHRIDNDRGYLCPKCWPPKGNCKWATRKEQNENKRQNCRKDGKCRNGHPMTEDNILLVSDGKDKGTRIRCKACTRARQDEWYTRVKTKRLERKLNAAT